MPEIVIPHMRARADQCRRLARDIDDGKAREVLFRMAEEIEQDIARLEVMVKRDGATSS